MKPVFQLLIAIQVFLPAGLSAEVNVQEQADGQFYTAVSVREGNLDRFDLVFVGDGFTANEQDLFNDKVDDSVTMLQTFAPFSEFECAFNIWRVNVVSGESGADHPKDGIERDTELDTRYGDPGDGEPERLIYVESPEKAEEAAGSAPDVDLIVVLVNDPMWGGAGGEMVVASIADNFATILSHELGHNIGALADEYDCLVCDGSDSDLAYTGDEPDASNLTIETDRTKIKWRSFIDDETEIPTTTGGTGVVGLFEGGGYYATGIFRPQESCHMESASADYCAVCARVLQKTLAKHCTVCELDPTYAACVYLRYAGQMKIKSRFEGLFVIRFPLPFCLDCYDESMEDKVDLFLDTDSTARLNLRIVDDEGTVISTTSNSGRDGVGSRFTALRSREYFAELTVKGHADEEFQMTPRIVRNGKEDKLATEVPVNKV